MKTNSTSSHKRKLAAILFADIVGYTALMQKDEQTASTLLRRFQKQLEEKVNPTRDKSSIFMEMERSVPFLFPSMP